MQIDCCWLQSRLEALNQLQELLSAPRFGANKMQPSASSDVCEEITLLGSAHHQLLVGCFGFGLLDGTDNITDGQLCHYQVMLVIIAIFDLLGPLEIVHHLSFVFKELSLGKFFYQKS